MARPPLPPVHTTQRDRERVASGYSEARLPTGVPSNGYGRTCHGFKFIRATLDHMRAVKAMWRPGALVDDRTTQGCVDIGATR